ncbi:MAG: hypothetical protein WCP57_09705 [Bacteroidota bacterium]
MIESIEDIEAAILQLEEQKVIEELALKKQLEITFEKIHPINFLKNTLDELQKSNQIRLEIAQIVVAYSNNILSKKIIESNIQNPLYKIGGIAILNKCTKIANDNPEWIVGTCIVLMRNLFKTKNKT